MNHVKDPGGHKFDTQHNVNYKLSFPDLMKLSLTANHLEAFLILLALGLNLLEEIGQVFDFNGQAYINSYARENVDQTDKVALLFIGIAIISVLFSVVRTLIKFFGFTLTDTSKEWKISFGLFNRQQKTIPLQKIQILSWRATWFRRKFDYWIMHVQAVGHNEKNRKQHVQIPVLEFPTVLKLASSYQEYIGIDPLMSNKIEPEYWKRKSLMVGLPFFLVPMAASWFWIGWWALGFVFIFIYLTGYFYKYYQNFCWKTPETGVQLRSGVWGRKFTLLNWKKIQQVHIHQSPYQRRHQLANVIFLTAGGKVVLPYLRLTTATALVDYVIYDVESKDENWM
jgi:putative membrane protein